MKRAFVLGIAGGTGSGKSVLARRIARALGRRAVVLPLDGYYRDRSAARGAARRSLNFDHPRSIDGSLVARHIRALARGETVRAPQYDYRRHRRLARTRTVALGNVDERVPDRQANLVTNINLGNLSTHHVPQ